MAHGTEGLPTLPARGTCKEGMSWEVVVAGIMDGKAIARKVEGEVRARVDVLRRAGVEPCLAMLLVGDDPASRVYIRHKERACKRAGLTSRAIRLPVETTETELVTLVHELNTNPSVHGILVQLPLPPGINTYRIINAISPNKDVDGFHFVNAGHLATDRTGLAPCTPKGVMRLLKECDVTLRGAHAVVVGRSRIVGRPMGAMFLAAHATVTTCHRYTQDTSALTRLADVVVVAVGKAGLVRGDWIKEGAVVVDVGINRLADGKLTGDVCFEEVAPKARLITPVPGGVGPMTVAMLMENTCLAAEQIEHARLMG